MLEKMNIDQERLPLLLPSALQWVAQYVVEDRGLGQVEAIVLIYNSRMYSRLAREDTKLWHYGPVALYEMLCDEKGWPRPDGHVYSEREIRD